MSKLAVASLAFSWYIVLTINTTFFDIAVTSFLTLIIGKIVIHEIIRENHEAVRSPVL